MASGMATRCSACGTVFRVVPDQLRVSEGWVRCGRCSEVFNAGEALLDLETGAPRRSGEEPPQRAVVQFTSGRPTAPSPAPAADADTDFRLDVPAPAAARPPPPPEERSARDTMPVVDESESRFAADAADAREAAAAAPADLTAEARPQPAATPLFLRQAERAARWRQPQVRAALGAVAVLGTLGLAAQVVFEYRDLAAARFAAARPALQQACAWLGCTVGAAHVIDSLVVESSGLVRVEKSDIYKLSVALRNRAALEVALPALEISLTDSQGKLVARRVLRTGELGVNQATLAAGRELALNATLQATTVPVAGYTIELFYP